MSADSQVSAPKPDSATTAGDVTLRTDKQSYRAGDQVTLTITNAGAAKHYFNPCTRVIEREAAASTWSELREERMCTMIAHVLEARSTRTERTELPTPLAAGRYRLTIALTEETTAGSSRSVRATSAPFTVQ